MIQQMLAIWSLIPLFFLNPEFLYVFSILKCTVLAGGNRPPPLFSPLVVIQFKILISPLLTDIGLFSAHAPCLPKLTLATSSGTHTRSQLQSRERYDFEIPTLVGIQWPPGGSWSEIFLAAYEWAVYWSPGYSQLKLYPFNALRYSYLPLSSPSPPTPQSELLILWVLWVRNGFQ